jgi:hypothetical protein
MAAHPTYVKQVGASVGLRDARDGKPKQTKAELAHHFNSVFEGELPGMLDLNRSRPGYFSKTEITQARNERARNWKAFITGYRFGYVKGKKGVRGFNLDESISAHASRRRKKNPGVKTVSLKNFTGKIRIATGVPAGAVNVTGRGKRG